jgi:hypothetical protein
LYDKRTCQFIDNHLNKCKLCKKKNQEVINSVIKYYSTNSINQIKNFQRGVDLTKREKETNSKSNKEIKSYKPDNYFFNVIFYFIFFVNFLKKKKLIICLMAYNYIHIFFI